MSRTPESVKNSLDKKHYNVYKLIYERFMASQMSEAKYNSVQIKIENSGYGFKASGKTLLFAGFTAVYQEIKKEDDEDESSKLLPDLKEGEELDLIKLASEQKFTKPPLRYTDASLVKAMEDKGIGRPSTYASIISVLNKRKYVKKDGKYMVPTEVSYKITDMLMQYFTDIMDVSFTARMEDKLDDIEEGGVDWHKIISDFYPPFAEKLVFAANDGDEPTDILCEKCGHPMVLQSGALRKISGVLPTIPPARISRARAWKFPRPNAPNAARTWSSRAASTENSSPAPTIPNVPPFCLSRAKFPPKNAPNAANS